MLAEILTCAMMSMTSVQDKLNTSEPVVMEETVPAADNSKDKFWAQRKSLRIGYDIHTFQNSAGGTFPVKFGLGVSNVSSIWFHKKPVAGMVKFAFDHGIDLNYTMFNTEVDSEGYSGPSGYLGSAPVEPSDGEDMPFDITKIGMHYLSVGYALGASVTVNPVAKLRVNGYFHFVPSAAVTLSGTMLNVGFMPYCKYGAEVTYSRIGVGFEWGSGMSNMSDMMSKLMSEDQNTETPKAKYYSNYAKIYLALRFGKSKKKK